MKPLRAWQRAVALVGIVKTLVGVFAMLVAVASGAVQVPSVTWVLGGVAVAFGSGGGLLLLGARRDRRAALLGTQFVLVSSAFADSLLLLFRERAGPGLDLLRAGFALPVDALSPYFLWAFVAEFPRPVEVERGRMLARWATPLTLYAGLVLLIAGVAWDAASRLHVEGFLVDVLRSMVARGGSPFYWIYVYASSLGALVMLAVRARTALVDERRRVRLLGYGLVAGAAPAVLWTIGVLVSPAFATALPRSTAGWVIYPALLSAPFTVAYAVLVHHALDVRFVLRRALQYATARTSLIALTTVPFALLVAELYRRREQSVGDVVGGRGGLALLGFAVLGVAAIRMRRPMMAALDRRFFREQYDAQLILTRLVERIQRAASAGEVADVIRVEVDRAMHLGAVHLLVLDPTEGSFWSQGTKLRPLPADSALAGILQARDGAIDAAVDSAGTLFNDLSETDQLWLTDSGARLLVGLKSSDRRLIGILVLGDKRSELPFSAEDRALLVAVASAAALSLNVASGEAGGRSPARDASGEDPVLHSAVECTHCGTLFQVGTAECTACEHPTTPAPVPLIVAGKFRVRQRVGRGAMGIVYRAVDLALDRQVAIKTLPRMQPEQAARLRREARAVASLSHPALAAIYGAESWLGMPMLILEYLGGGTLADRLAKGPIPVSEALALGVVLSDGLRAIHAAGVLHRDIKPSNIGFAADGSPRILDFGLSRLLSGAHGVDPWSRSSREQVRTAVEASHDELHATSTAEGQIVGTPLYMSPEAVAAADPAPSFDVWGLCIVLYEAIAGVHPMRAPSVPAILQRIRDCDVPPLTQHMPNAPAALVRFFAESLHSSSRLRPASAATLGHRLSSLQSELASRG